MILHEIILSQILLILIFFLYLICNLKIMWLKKEKIYTNCYIKLIINTRFKYLVIQERKKMSIKCNVIYLLET